MTTTSTYFNFNIAEPTDQVNVTSQISNNFTTIDTLIAVNQTGTGQFKSGLVITAPTLISPVISGTATGGNFVGSTGYFNTITATGGALTVNSLTVGTYAVPATIGTANAVLTVVTGNALWQVPTGTATGADFNLSNLTAVAINTNLNTFTAGFVTLARIVATSGALTGLTAFQATTGTFAGNLVVSGTVTANVLNATGGTITAGGFAIGTYSYPATVGSTGQILRVTTGNLVFASAASGAGVILHKATNFSSINSNTHVNITVTANKIYDVHITVSGSGMRPSIVVNDDTGPSSYKIIGTTTGANIPMTTTAVTNPGYFKSQFRFDTHPGGSAGTEGRLIAWGDAMYMPDATSALARHDVQGVYHVSGAIVTGFGVLTTINSMATGSIYVWERLTTT